MRLIEIREDDGPLSMAIDEAILVKRMEGKVPDTFRLFRFKPSCISLGYFQSYADEIFHENRLENGVDAVRRITGGGAVYHDYEGEITYSVVANEKTVGHDIVESYEKVCGGLVKSLEEFGLDGQFHPINDVLIGQKKVSGSAQTRRGDAVLQHGTMMYATDIDAMFSVLNVSKAKMADKILQGIKDRVVTISQALERDVKEGEVIAAMEKGFAEVFGEMERSELTQEELELAQKLYKEKYSTDAWLNRR